MNPPRANEPLRHRWFQFRLRTLLVGVGVGVLAIPIAYVGYSLRWIRARHDVLSAPNTFVVSGKDAPGPMPAPFMLRWLGEEGVVFLWLPEQHPVTLDRARQLFPEATVGQGKRLDKW